MKKNLFSDIPHHIPDELIEVIRDSENVRIERIVSKGHSTPEGFWYDQKRCEFVILLKGGAELAFYGKGERVIMKPGDFIDIGAHVKHRVEWTDPEETTVWLAIHYEKRREGNILFSLDKPA